MECPWCRRVVVDRVERWVGGRVGDEDVDWRWALSWVGPPLGVLALFLAALAAAYFYGYGYQFGFLLIRSFLLASPSFFMDGIDKHPRYGAVLMLLGLCVGSWEGWRWLGFGLLELGKVPFDEKILKAYEVHTWKVLAGLIAVQWVLARVKVPGGEMVKQGAGIQMMRCAVIWIAHRLI